MFDQYTYHVEYDTEYVKELINDNYKILPTSVIENDLFIIIGNDSMFYEPCLSLYKIQNNYLYLCLINDSFLIDSLFESSTNIDLNSNKIQPLTLIEYDVNDHKINNIKNAFNLENNRLICSISEKHDFNEFDTDYHKYSEFFLYNKNLLAKFNQDSIINIPLIDDSNFNIIDFKKILISSSIVAILSITYFYIFSNNDQNLQQEHNVPEVKKL